MIVIVPATRAHVAALDGHLRAGDAAEVAAAGITQGEALYGSMARSLWAWAALDAGEVCAVWGIIADSLTDQHARAWLLTGPGVDRNRKAFLRHTRAWCARMAEVFPVLSADVSADYGCAIRWLRWLGFDVLPAAPCASGALFHRVERGHV
jgi:hypothetical protein